MAVTSLLNSNRHLCLLSVISMLVGAFFGQTTFDNCTNSMEIGSYSSISNCDNGASIYSDQIADTLDLVLNERATYFRDNLGYTLTATSMTHFIENGGITLNIDSSLISTYDSVSITATNNRENIISRIFDIHDANAVNYGQRVSGELCQYTSVDLTPNTTLYTNDVNSDFHYAVGNEFEIITNAKYCAIPHNSGSDSVDFAMEITHTFWNYYDFDVSQYLGEFSVYPAFNTPTELGYCLVQAGPISGYDTSFFVQTSSWTITDTSLLCGIAFTGGQTVFSQDGTCPCNVNTDTPTYNPSNHPTNDPTIHPSINPSNNPTNVPSLPTMDPSEMPTYKPSDNPSIIPTNNPSKNPTDLPTYKPSIYPSINPSLYPTNNPTTPTFTPSDTPLFEPTANPTDITNNPTKYPSNVPSLYPSDNPTTEPSNKPSNDPTRQPSNNPTNIPSHMPSGQPSGQPSNMPSIIPTNIPSNNPSIIPSGMPSNNPSEIPSNEPSNNPTNIPSLYPSNIPTNYPSNNPSAIPSDNPTNMPSGLPTSYPSLLPTSVPSNCDAYCGVPWVFVVDDTGSMGSDIAAVKYTINSLISNTDDPQSYTLSIFNDAEYYAADPLAFNTAENWDAATEQDGFLSAVNDMEVHGGGDCPEYAMDGIKKAISATPNIVGADMFLFTDADAKDGDTDYATVRGLLLSNSIRLFAIISGICYSATGVDEVYSNLVTSTGGLLIPTTHSEIGDSVAIIEAFLTVNIVDLFQATTSANTYSAYFTVDGTLETFTLIATADLDDYPSITLTTPNGISPYTNYVHYNQYSANAAMKVNIQNANPGEVLTGVWRADFVFDTTRRRLYSMADEMRRKLLINVLNGILIYGTSGDNQTEINFEFVLKSYDSDNDIETDSTTSITYSDGDYLRIYAILASGETEIESVDTITLATIDGVTETEIARIDGYDSSINGYYADFSFNLLLDKFSTELFRAHVTGTRFNGEPVVRYMSEVIEFSDLAITIVCNDITDSIITVEIGTKIYCDVDIDILSDTSTISTVTLSSSIEPNSITSDISVTLDTTSVSIEDNQGSTTLTIIIENNDDIEGETFSVVISATGGGEFNFDEQIFLIASIFRGCEQSIFPDAWGINSDIDLYDNFYVSCYVYDSSLYLNDGNTIEFVCEDQDAYTIVDTSNCNQGCDFRSNGWGITDFVYVNDEVSIECSAYDELYISGTIDLKCLGSDEYEMGSLSDCIEGDWVFVEPNPECNYEGTCDGSYLNPHATIEDGLKAIGWETKDLVLKSGTYTGDGNVGIAIENNYKGQIFRSRDGAQTTIIDCESNTFGWYLLQGIRTFEFEINGITWQNCVSTKGGALRVESATAIFIDCIFLNNVADEGGAIYTLYATTTMKSSLFYGNEANDVGGAMYIQSATMYIEDETILINNYARSTGGAFYIQSSWLFMSDGSYSEKNIAGEDVGNEIDCIQANGIISDTSRIVTLVENPTYLNENDFNCFRCQLIQKNIEFDYCDPDYNDITYQVGSNGDTIYIENNTISITYEDGIFDDNTPIVIEQADTPATEIVQLIDNTVTPFYGDYPTQNEVTITVLGPNERPTTDKELTVTVKVTDDDLIETYNSDSDAVYVMYVSCWEETPDGLIGQYYRLDGLPSYNGDSSTVTGTASTNCFYQNDANYEMSIVISMISLPGATNSRERRLISQLEEGTSANDKSDNNNVLKRRLQTTVNNNCQLKDTQLCEISPIVCPIETGCDDSSISQAFDGWFSIGTWYSVTQGTKIYSPWSGYIEDINYVATYGNYVVIRLQDCSQAKSILNPAIMLARLDSASVSSLTQGQCLDVLDINNVIGTIDSTNLLYVKYASTQALLPGTINTATIKNSHTCTEPAGKIYVADAGIITSFKLSLDDNFNVYVDGNYRGTTTLGSGSADSFLFNPIPNNKDYRDANDSYTVELEVVTAPDGWGTYYIEFDASGSFNHFQFDDETMIVEETVFGPNVKEFKRFTNVVCYD